MNTNNAPERIELGGGWAFVQYGLENVGLYKLDIPDVRDTGLVFEKQSVLKYAAAMQPQVSESDEAVLSSVESLLRKTAERVTNHNGDLGVNGTVGYSECCDIYIAHKMLSSAIARHRQPAFVAEKSALEIYEGRQPAAVSADAVRMREAIGYAIARLEDDEVDQALNTLKVARGDYVRDHYPDDNSRMAVKQLRDAVNGLAAPIDYADALLRYIEQLERGALSPETVCGGEK